MDRKVDIVLWAYKIANNGKKPNRGKLLWRAEGVDIALEHFINSPGTQIQQGAYSIHAW